LELLIAHGQLLMVHVRQCDGVLEGEQVLSTPGALERLGDVVLTVLAVRVAERGQGERVACASENGCEDGHARGAGAVTHDLGACAVHLWQGLVHGLHMVRAVGEEPLTVTESAAEHAELIVGAEGGGEPSRGVEALQPLAVEPIGVRSSGGACGVPKVDEEDLDAARLHECKHGNPGDPGRCHRDSGDPVVKEPVSQGVTVGGAGAETAHGLGVAPRGHRDPVLGFADVDARGVGVADLEGVGKHG
jgi:hypothetical protein